MTHGPCSHRLLLNTSLALAAVLTGCSSDGALSLLRPKMVLDPEPPAALGFGEVVLGRTTADPLLVHVENLGDAGLEIASVQVEGEGGGQFRVSSAPKRLFPSQSGDVFVRFEPDVPIPASAELVLVSNDPARPEVRYPLVGPAREPCRLSMSPPHQSFLLGEIREVTITAASTYECEIVRLFTDRNLFEILDEPELPFVIAAGETVTLEVQHVETTNRPGIPTRELRVKEGEGTEGVVSFAGEPPVYGCFDFFPDRIAFPRTPLGETERRRVTVNNRCSREAAVSSVVVGHGYNFFSVDRSLYPQVVPPLGSADVWVTYHPSSAFGDAGLLTINTNDAANPRFKVELYGEAALPRIETFPAALDFGTVVFRNPQGEVMRSECSSRAQVVKVFSTGDVDLVIGRLEIDSAGDPYFQIASVTVGGAPVTDLSAPISVAPDQEMRIAVQFFPTRTDPPEHRGRLFIRHNAEGGVSEVELIGRGTGEGATTDTFEQLEGPKVDILWVIDDSCSMYDEQARLISNLSRFVGYADSQHADYQMAVAIAESRSSNAGKFRRCFPHPAVIGSRYADTATREEAFECLFDVGTQNTAQYEAGLGGAMRALERATDRSMDPANNLNRGFIRPDAKLAIVAVSDEEDQSLEGNEVLRDFYFSVKGSHRPDRVAVHAIAGPVDEPCGLGTRFAEAGYRYYWMAQQTNGFFFNICEEDWQPVLERLGLEVFTPNDEWDLNQAADPSSLEVLVDGVPIARDAQSGYLYNPQGNSIRFGPNAVPAPGAEITATYVGLCRP